MLSALFPWSSHQDLYQLKLRKIFLQHQKGCIQKSRGYQLYKIVQQIIIQNFLGKPSETIIQLHGDEDIDYCKEIRKKIPNIGLWKAFRIKTEKDIDKIRPFEDFVDAILLDSWNKETYGGSGKKINPIYLKNVQFSKPWWLAGGISIEWIDEILTDLKPDGIDISSSIEISPGLKDIKKTEDLFKFLERNQ